jgi:hypothetical protein
MLPTPRDTVPDRAALADLIRAEHEWMADAKLRALKRYCAVYGADEKRIRDTFDIIGIHRSAAEMADQLAALAERFGRAT